MVSWGAHILVLLLWDENVMQKDSKGAFTLATQDYRDTYERFSTDEKAQITKQAQQTSSYVYNSKAQHGVSNYNESVLFISALLGDS